jgi:hypothetical protein
LRDFVLNFYKGLGLYVYLNIYNANGFEPAILPTATSYTRLGRLHTSKCRSVFNR